ncbi:MAG: response regulator transcription factor [Chloroflexi bacterium]|nr:response regulator transcription factor [Chloroflexota bacterium]
MVDRSVAHQLILVADDEQTVREIVRKYLEKEGFQVIEAQTGPEVLQSLYQNRPDLIVLDIMLPGLDGLTIMRSLREPVDVANSDTSTIPVIMLTARTTEEDRITGFELGADDYVVKPFSPRELVMRVKAVLRRGEASGPASDEATVPLDFGSLALDPNTRTVTQAGYVIELTAKEFELLWFMARHPRQVFSRTQLLDKVWGYEFFGDESTVTVHIHRLREKIEPDPSKPVYIHTVWGVGYKFEVIAPAP